MFSRTLLLVLLFIGTLNQILAQEKWSLQKCIQYAQQNSNNIKQGAIAVKSAELSLRGNKEARYPNASGNISGAYQFGRTIDPTSNTFETSSIGTNGLSVSAGVIVYDGNRLRNSIKQSEFDIQAAEANLDQQGNDIAIDVATAYLNILFSIEQLENAKKRLAQTNAQLDQTNRLIRAGTLPENDRLEIQANVARDEQSIITQENNLEIGYLNLKQLMQLEPDYDLVVDKPASIPLPDSNLEILNLNNVYKKAMQTQPFIIANDLNLKSAELAVDIAKSGYYPTLSIGGSLSTNYSTRGRTFIEEGIFQNTINGSLPDGTPFSLNVEQPIDIFGDASYGTQLNENFGQSISARLSIPIYSNGQTKIAEERARLNIINQQITNNISRQQLKTQIQQAIANARAAQKQFEASERTVEALRVSYANTEKRYKLGAINTFEYTSAKNTLDQAEVDSIVAKYDYLFKVKILDFYQGKKLTF